ncbi:MAG: hypothetical protein ACK4SR_13735 [Thiobacillus sp.]
MISLLSVYLFVCAALPAMIARRRGLSLPTQAGIAIFGALTGWTIFGAIAAWVFALFDDLRRPIITIR